MKSQKKHVVLWMVLVSMGLISLASRLAVAQETLEVSPHVPTVATYSIVAFDPQNKQWGVAVQSKFVAVGAVVPWAQSGVGAIATQAFANVTYGADGLDLLASGKSASEVVKILTDRDSNRDLRQLGVVDAQGGVATFTGLKAMEWAGGKTGKNYAIQGNILAGPGVVNAMATAYEQARGDFGERLIQALDAGEKAGGDRRGRQSAALLIVKKNAGYAGQNDRYRDLRVDDHTDPINELLRIYNSHKTLFPPQ
jgi:uncharacterized Ntn-hydrolase superfamily protein